MEEKSVSPRKAIDLIACALPDSYISTQNTDNALNSGKFGRQGLYTTESFSANGSASYHYMVEFLVTLSAPWVVQATWR